MKYMLLIYDPADAFEGEGGQAALEAIVARHMALAAELRGKGWMTDGSGLQDVTTATTVATGPDGRQSLHDGPFAETREHLGGYYLVDVPNLDDALAVARRIPVAPGGKVEVRPLAVR